MALTGILLFLLYTGFKVPFLIQHVERVLNYEAISKYMEVIWLANGLPTPGRIERLRRHFHGYTIL